jgi:hypothetical protein
VDGRGELRLPPLSNRDGGGRSDHQWDITDRGVPMTLRNAVATTPPQQQTACNFIAAIVGATFVVRYGDFAVEELVGLFSSGESVYTHAFLPTSTELYANGEEVCSALRLKYDYNTATNDGMLAAQAGRDSIGQSLAHALCTRQVAVRNQMISRVACVITILSKSRVVFVQAGTPEVVLVDSHAAHGGQALVRVFASPDALVEYAVDAGRWGSARSVYDLYVIKPTSVPRGWSAQSCAKAAITSDRVARIRGGGASSSSSSSAFPSLSPAAVLSSSSSSSSGSRRPPKAPPGSVPGRNTGTSSTCLPSSNVT